MFQEIIAGVIGVLVGTITGLYGHKSGFFSICSIDNYKKITNLNSKTGIFNINELKQKTEVFELR